MKTFTQVVDAGSFVEAARRMHLSKAVITERINQLEQGLGVRLLQRSTRSLSVTDSGAVFYERCITILSDVDDTEAEVSSMSLEPKGLLKVGCVSIFAATYLDSDLCEFQNKYPSVTIDMRHIDSSINPIAEGFDIVFQPGLIQADNIATQSIVTLNRVIVASPGYLEKHGTPQHPDELEKHRCMHNDNIDGLPTWLLTRNGKDYPVRINPVIWTDNGWLMRQAALQDNVLAILPLFFIEKDLIEGKLIPLLTDYKLPNRTLIAHYTNIPHIPLKVRLLLELLTNKYSPVIPWEHRLKTKFPSLCRD